MGGVSAKFGPRPAVVLGLAFLCGCASCFPKHSLKFRTVDATTGKPIAGVSAQRLSASRVIMGIPFFPGTPGNFALGTSDNDGMVVAEGLCPDLKHDFAFQKAGYLNAGAHWAEGDQILLDLPPTDPHHDRRLRSASAKGVVEIKLYPEGTPVADYRPVWTAIPSPPPNIIQVAERVSQAEHPHESSQWHSEVGALRVFKNQYGDYWVLWLARDRLRGGFQWETVQITPPDAVTGYASGAHHTASTPPDIRSIQRSSDQ